jgi:hypothetical protein
MFVTGLHYPNRRFVTLEAAPVSTSSLSLHWKVRNVSLVSAWSVFFLLWGIIPISRVSAGETNSALAVALESIRQEDLTEQIGTLADDKMQGREAGTVAGRRAGDLLAEEFRELGLKPLGRHGSYFQHFGESYRNILGYLPGSDPSLRNEFILVGAHYDHVGVREKEVDGEKVIRVYNGADDNASGTGAVLELAEAFSIMPLHPKRSILFALWDAEEKGLVGSKFFTEYPRVPLRRIVGVLNLDMIGSLRDEKLFVIGSRSGLGFRERICRLNDQSNLRLEFPKKMWYNSDHAPFYRKKIPAVFFFTGFTTTYHKPEDDLERLNLAGLVRINRLAFRLLWELANEPGRIAYRTSEKNVDALEKVFLDHRRPPCRLGISLRGSPQNLAAVLDEIEVDGEMIENATSAAVTAIIRSVHSKIARTDFPFADPSEEDSQASTKIESASPGELVLEIERVVDDSPARGAGIETSDRLVSLQGRPLTSTGDYHARLSQSEGPVELTLEDTRGKRRTVTLTPSGEPHRLGFTFWFDSAEPNAAIVGYVFEGLPADRAGLESGDRIYEIEHQRVTQKVMDSIAKSPPEQLHLLIERQGRLMERSIDLSGNRRVPDDSELSRK